MLIWLNLISLDNSQTSPINLVDRLSEARPQRVFYEYYIIWISEAVWCGRTLCGKFEGALMTHWPHRRRFCVWWRIDVCMQFKLWQRTLSIESIREVWFWFPLSSRETKKKNKTFALFLEPELRPNLRGKYAGRETVALCTTTARTTNFILANSHSSRSLYGIIFNIRFWLRPIESYTVFIILSL